MPVKEEYQDRIYNLIGEFHQKHLGHIFQFSNSAIPKDSISVYSCLDCKEHLIIKVRKKL